MISEQERFWLAELLLDCLAVAEECVSDLLNGTISLRDSKKTIDRLKGELNEIRSKK